MTTTTNKITMISAPPPMPPHISSGFESDRFDFDRDFFLELPDGAERLGGR